MKKLFLLGLLFIVNNLSAQLQPDTVKGIWPFPPFNSSHTITGAFAEFRNTQSSDHFHNAVDIPQADGNPCYPSLDGTVYSKVEGGHNAYIRIATKVGNKWKHITYLHINPNPSLSIGDKVKKGETVIGTVVNTMGHVHMIERELVSAIDNYGFEVNNLRKNGGLTPFVDNWAPVIEGGTLKFFKNASSEVMDANNLHGKVDIRIKIRDIHGSGEAATNNGTYIAGYRIWNETKTKVVYEPADNGVKYRFDWKPLNAYVHKAYAKGVATLSNPVYWLTNGKGANEINSSKEVNDNYFDASALSGGKYQLEIFTEDTRDNKTDKFFPITITDPKPDVPLLYAVLNYDFNQGIKVAWKQNDESDIKGYRLYYSVSDSLTDWKLAADETKLTTAVTEYSFSSTSEFIVPPSKPANYFALVAVDKAGQESDKSDVYTCTDGGTTVNDWKIMIVNGFELKTSKGKRIGHQFVPKYFSSLPSSLHPVVSSISHRVFLDGIRGISLNDYDVVFWFTGDNTNHTTTILPKEMSNIALFLEQGKRLFISGAKIGYDLDERHGSGVADTLFYFHYLKSEFVYVGDDSMTPAVGKTNTGFGNVTLNYVEKYPDDINPINGSEVLFNYSTKRPDSTYRHAGIGYKGKFGKSSNDGYLVYLAFPFESVASLSERRNFVNHLLNYFDIIIEDVNNGRSELPNKFELTQNYPNPFNPSTTIEYSIPADNGGKTFRKVSLVVYDVLGRKIKTLVNKEQKAGFYNVTFSAEDMASGIYFYRLQCNDVALTKKMILLK